MTNKFTFCIKRPELKEGIFVAVVPKNISSKDELMSCLSNQLNMPSYFGKNWDALEDMLVDLSWISERVIFIWHEEMPKLGPADLGQYLTVLDSSANGWKIGEVHELVAGFTEAERELVQVSMDGR